MAGRIRQEDVEAVRERSDIVEVVGGYSQLKKAGRDAFVALCPFHPEKTPSLSISPSKQVYYCFGCGEGGNVFRFLQKVENLSFTEAVERLARQAGVALRYEGETAADRRAASRRQVLYRVNADAAGLFNRTLMEGREAEQARAYLASRGISAECVARFGIGYAPAYPDFLLKRLAKTYSPEMLLEAGLVAKDASGSLRDRFRGRVMFPVHDVSDNVVGFGGRLVEGSDVGAGTAKYVNSPDTPVYRKGSLLYNLNRAKANVSSSGRAFLVEGYTDVIALAQAGIPSAVATCGTALGEDHLRVLSRFAERIVLAFDSDEAGARAAERAYQYHERYPAELMVLVLPDGEDPSDFVMRSGGEAFVALAARAVPLVEFMIARSLAGRDLTDVEEKARAVREAVGLLAHLSDPVRRHEYAGQLADRVAVPVGSILLELQQRSGAPSVEEPRTPARLAPTQKVEREALKLLVQAPRGALPRAAAIPTDRFSGASHRAAFELIREEGERLVAPGSVQALVAKAHERGDQLGKLLAAAAVEPLEAEGEPTDDYVERVFLRLEELALGREIDSARKDLARLNPLTSPEEHDALFERLIALEGNRRRLRAAAEAVGSPL